MRYFLDIHISRIQRASVIVEGWQLTLQGECVVYETQANFSTMGSVTHSEIDYTEPHSGSFKGQNSLGYLSSPAM